MVARPRPRDHLEDRPGHGVGAGGVLSRILFVSTSTTLGGAEKTLYSLATLVDPKRYTVCDVVSLKPLGHYGRKLQEAGIDVQSLELRGRPTFKHVNALAKIIDHQRPDIVHAVMYQAIQLTRLAKRRCQAKFKLVTSPRVSYRTRSVFTLFVDRALKNVDDLLIAECEASRRYLLGRLGYDPKKVVTIYNGVDVANWPASKTDRAQRRLELRLAAGDVLIGCVGRLDAQKGHGTLLDAMAKIKGRFPARCAIIGDGPRRRALEAQIRRNALEKHVWLLGERDDVVSWLSAFDVFALPSFWEGLPNALLEAMALGVPPVASNVDGIPEVIVDGKSGLLVPPKDSLALAKALATLAGDAGLRARLAAQAQKTVAERFGLLRMIEAYQDAYEKLYH